MNIQVVAILAAVWTIGGVFAGLVLSIEHGWSVKESAAFVAFLPLCVLVMVLLGIRGLVRRALDAARIE